MLQGADRSKIAEGVTSEMPDVAGLIGRIKALEETLTAQQAAMEARINIRWLASSWKSDGPLRRPFAG